MTIAFICAFIYYHFKQRHFKIVKATSRKWLTHRKGDLVTYRIQILTRKNSAELKLDELWIDNKLFKVRILSKETNTSATRFSEKEMLYLEAERETENIGFEEMTPPTKGKVSIGYLINNKRRYLSIKGFEEHEPRLSLASRN